MEFEKFTFLTSLEADGPLDKVGESTKLTDMLKLYCDTPAKQSRVLYISPSVDMVVVDFVYNSETNSGVTYCMCAPLLREVEEYFKTRGVECKFKSRFEHLWKDGVQDEST